MTLSQMNLASLTIKFHGTMNDPLPVLPDNEQDLGHENIVNIYLLNQMCKVHDTVSFGDQSPNRVFPE